MNPFSKYLISYETPFKKIHEREVGGKGFNLFRLRNFGFPVLPWCVVSTGVFDMVMAAQRERISIILRSMDCSDSKAVELISTSIGARICNSQLSDQFSRQILTTLQELFGEEMLFSVRSSVVGEDSEENSFAGQMDSFLNVRTGEVFGAIKKVWASAFSSRSLAYRYRKNISLTEVSTAVIVQQMVQSAASGVLFTRDPEGKAKQCVISAGFGLGDGVVANRVEADTYLIDWNSDEIAKEVRVKDGRVVLDSIDRRGTRTVPLPLAMQSQQVLTDTRIRDLRDVGIQAEECFGAPQDIEWAFDDCGRLFILQSRPIVFSKDTSLPSDFRIWDNSNIVESYPGLTLPLTFTFVRSGYENSFRNAALGFLFFKSALKGNLHIFKNMIGLLDGRIYYNLLNWYKMLSFLPGFKKHKDSWDQMIGISKKIDFPTGKLSPLDRFCSLAIVIWKLLTVSRTARKFFSHFNSVYRKFEDMDVSAATEYQLVAIYESLAQELTDKWHLTLDNDLCAMKYYDWLMNLCNLWGLDDYVNLHNNLLCGESGVESVAPVRSLVRIAEMFRAEPVLRVLLSEEDDHAVWKTIQREPAYEAIKDALKVHLQAFGDRGLEELKLETPTLREHPALLIRLIKNYDLLGLSVETMENQEQDIRRNAERIVRKHLKNPFKRLLFWFVLRNARCAIVNRENMRFARSRIYGIVKRLFRCMAVLFVEKDLLESSSDIYYLTVEEVFGIIQGTAVTQNLKALVKIRKAEYAEFSRRTPKERIQTKGIAYLNYLSEGGARNETGKALKGIGCSSGIAQGKARVILDPRSNFGNGDHILVARSTDPGWVFLMISSKGIIVEKGSVLSHTAIIGRELGIPTIVGVKDATGRIPDGVQISLDGSTGEIRWE